MFSYINATVIYEQLVRVSTSCGTVDMIHRLQLKIVRPYY